MAEDMDRAGVSTAILLGWYWERAETCREHNRFLCEIAAQDPSRFIPFAALQLRDNPRALDDLDEAVRNGCRGVGELLPGVQGYSLDDMLFAELCGYAAERHLPIVLHVTEGAGRRHAGRVDTPFMELVELAASNPDTIFIFAHWGGGLPFYALNPHVRASLANVYFDSAASPLMYDSRVWGVVRDLVGPERLLFGSDYPLRIYPKRQKQADFTGIVEEFRESGLTDVDLRMMGGGNLRRILEHTTEGSGAVD